MELHFCQNHLLFKRLPFFLGSWCLLGSGVMAAYPIHRDLVDWYWLKLQNFGGFLTFDALVSILSGMVFETEIIKENM